MVGLAAVYTALSFGAIEARAADLEPLLQGDMAKLTLTGMRGSDVAFFDESGAEMQLAAYEGQVVLVNFWATWCGPCRAEMATLSALQEQLGSDDFAVLTIASGRNPAPAITAFMEEIGVDNLPLATDPRQALARDMGVLGLPTTLILGRDGQEIGRLLGEADWASPEAVGLLEAIVAE